MKKPLAVENSPMTVATQASWATDTFSSQCTLNEREKARNAPLRPALRLIHCLQKERGASCVLVSARSQQDPTINQSFKASDSKISDQHPYARSLCSCRIATNSAIASFYDSRFWRFFAVKKAGGHLEVVAVLGQIRQLVDGVNGNDLEMRAVDVVDIVETYKCSSQDSTDIIEEYGIFHQVFTEFNSLLSLLINTFVTDTIAKRKNDFKNNAPVFAAKLGSSVRCGSSDDMEQTTQLDGNEETPVTLLSILLSFVKLKESLGMERAILSGLKAFGNANPSASYIDDVNTSRGDITCRGSYSKDNKGEDVFYRGHICGGSSREDIQGSKRESSITGGNTHNTDIAHTGSADKFVEDARLTRVSEDNTKTAHIQSRDKSNPSRLPKILNHLVMVVENQHRIMQNLEMQTGVVCESWIGEDDKTENVMDENYRSLLRLVGKSIELSEHMKVLQNRIRVDFDIHGFQMAMTMDEFWTEITLYMDRLHSMELFLLEELDHCRVAVDDIDLLQLTQTASLTTDPSMDCASIANQSSLTSFHDVITAVGLSWNGLPQQHLLEIVKTLSGDELKESLVSFLMQQQLSVDGQWTTQDNSVEMIYSNKEGTLAKSPQSTTVLITPDATENPPLEEWEISLYDVEFHKRIGRGAAGTTYLGKWCGQYVALKVAAISEMGLDGWKNELSSLKRLHHNNIIRFMGAIYNPSPLTYCLVLEYCNSGDLSHALANRTPPNFFTCVTSGVANGLCYLHKKDVLHRDVKPANVLLHGDVKLGQFTAKLTDFGLAAKIHSSVSNGGVQLTAETGTYRYMAPEVIRHEPYQFSADVYSFALLMWEITTREVPFRPLSQIEAAGSVALEGSRPPFPERVPPPVKALIEKCWAEDPKERIDFDTIVLELEDFNNMLPEWKSWIQHPYGHPVYEVVTKDQLRGNNAGCDGAQPNQPNRLFLLRNGLLNRIRRRPTS